MFVRWKYLTVLNELHVAWICSNPVTGRKDIRLTWATQAGAMREPIFYVRCSAFLVLLS
jgi:hypothetical protein